MTQMTTEPDASDAQQVAVSAQAGTAPHVAVLGAGPAGLAAALTLARRDGMKVSVLERSDIVGGNAGSFQLAGVWCDHGSHRLHPVSGERVLNEVKSILGDDLLLRPRHGRILLQGQWIHFPLKPLDLLLRLPKKFTASLALDTVGKVLPREPVTDENFATVLERGLGKTMSESFYYPYVQKLWGVEPSQLAVTLAERRVSGSSVVKILQKVAQQIPGFGSKTSGKFFYPRQGYGQICTGLHEAAAGQGADFVMGASVTRIGREGSRITDVSYTHDGEDKRISADAVWSTLPISMMVRMIDPAPPPEVLAAASRIRFRGMILIYLVLEQAQFSEYDAHYFPELSIPMSRMSEPKNYSATDKPLGRTVLCAELPSDPSEPEWDLSDKELGERMCQWLESVGLPVTSPVSQVMTKRLRFAYPVYDRDYEENFKAMDDWLNGLDGLLTFGRQGLFAHDNTHHAMTMAYAASDCFAPDGQFDWDRWATYRHEFESHVVED